MDFAINYHHSFLALMKPFLGKHLVEVGAGTGAFSKLLFRNRAGNAFANRTVGDV